MNKTEKKAGLVAGISLVVMAIAAGFSYGFVQNELLNESAEITRQNLVENKSLFLAGIAGWIVIFITDLLVSGALYILFRDNMKRVSALTAITRLIYTAVLGFAIYQLTGILPLLQKAGTSLEISSHFESFEKIWSVGLIIFGFHLLGLGYLSVKSKFIPWFLAYLLYIAGVSYVLIHAANQFTFFSQTIISSAESILSLPMALGEMLLAFWLIYKGLKRNKSIQVK
jgi:hypothetical protein